MEHQHTDQRLITQTLSYASQQNLAHAKEKRKTSRYDRILHNSINDLQRIPRVACHHWRYPQPRALSGPFGGRIPPPVSPLWITAFRGLKRSLFPTTWPPYMRTRLPRVGITKVSGFHHKSFRHTHSGLCAKSLFYRMLSGAPKWCTRTSAQKFPGFSTKVSGFQHKSFRVSAQKFPGFVGREPCKSLKNFEFLRGRGCLNSI
jgi:hypothetical protein